MTPEQWKRLKPIFDGALAQPVDARRAWVQQACGSDDALLREAEALLASHETAGDFLEEPARLDPSDLDTLPEGTALGSYRIVREIGRGGMGVVYLAEDNLGRQVAIKTLPPILAANNQLRERLRREAHAAATINHPAVATVYVLDEIDGHLVIVSEYVQGDTLRTLLSRGAMESTHAHALAVEIAGALAAAHRARVDPSRPQTREHHRHARRAHQGRRFRHRAHRGARTGAAHGSRHDARHTGLHGARTARWAGW